MYKCTVTQNYLYKNAHMKNKKEIKKRKANKNSTTKRYKSTAHFVTINLIQQKN